MGMMFYVMNFLAPIPSWNAFGIGAILTKIYLLGAADLHIGSNRRAKPFVFRIGGDL